MTLDPSSRIPRLVLAAGTAVAVLFILYVGRGASLSSDELIWFSEHPIFDLGEAFGSYSGHLVALPRLIYELVFRLTGADYLPFRLMTVAAVSFAAWGVFFYLREAIGEWLALLPALVLLFFGPDALHVLHGNGLTVVGASAFGIWGLVALRRGDLVGDLMACLLLTLGVFSYTVALGFLAVAVVRVLWAREPRRFWVVGIPVLCYLAWRIVVTLHGTDESGVTYSNIMLFPSWVFQSVGAIAAALTGMGFQFTEGGWAAKGGSAGPALAVALLGLFAWRLRRPVDVRLISVLVGIMVLFLLQDLAWAQGIREPGSARYLFPGAVLLVMLAGECLRGVRPDGRVFAIAAVVALGAIMVNTWLLAQAGKDARNRADVVSLEGAAVRAIDPGARPWIRELPRAANLGGILMEPFVSFTNQAQRELGSISDSEQQLAALPPDRRERFDQILGAAYGLGFDKPEPGPWVGCRPIGTGAGWTQLDSGKSLVKGPHEAGFTARRFADTASVDLGRTSEGLIVLPGDDLARPWLIQASAGGMKICRRAGRP